MNARLSKTILFVLALSLLAASFALMTIRSSDLASALFLLTYVAVLFFVSPFVGLLVYIVFNYWPPQAFMPTLVSFRIMLLTGGGTFLVMLFRQIAGRERSYFFKSPQDIFVVWFAAAIVMSHLSHADPGFAVEALWGFSSVLIVYFLTINLVTTEKRFYAVLVTIALCTLALAIRAIYQHLTGTAMIEFGAIEAERAFGAGRFENPNMLAIAILCATPFTYLMTTGRGALGAKAFWICITIVLGAGLYFTNSRGGVLSFAAVAALLFVRRYGVWKGMVAGALIAAGAFVFGPSRMATISTQEASAMQRMLTWNEGLSHFMSFPLFGIGAGAWGEKYHTMVAHNSFIHCAAEVGLFGLIPWVLMIYIASRNALFISSDDRSAEMPRFRLTTEALFLALVGFVVASMFISKTYHPLLFILVGLSVSATHIFVESDERSFDLFEKRDAIIGIIAIAVVLTVFKLFLMIIGM